MDAAARLRVAAVVRAVGAARRRLFVQTATARLAIGLGVSALAAAPVLLALRSNLWPGAYDGYLLPLAVILAGCTLVAACLQRQPWLDTARRVDERARGRDQLSTALWLASEGRTDAWAEVQARAANDLAATLRLPDLLPWRRSLQGPVGPGHAGTLATGLLAGTIALWLPLGPLQAWSAGAHPEAMAAGLDLALPQPPIAFTSAAALLGRDATALLTADRALLAEIEAQVDDPATRKWLREVREVIEGVTEGQLDKRQALEQLARLEAERPDHLDLPQPATGPDPEAEVPVAPADPALADKAQDQAVRNAIVEAAKAAAQAAPKGEEKAALVQAAEQKDLEALAKLAEKLAGKDMDDKELEGWIKALEKFAGALKDQKIPDRFKALAERIDRLQQKRAQEGGLGASDQQRLKQARHELAQLERNEGNPVAAQSRVQRLERGVKQAADALRRERQQERLGPPGKDGQRGGQDGGAGQDAGGKDGGAKAGGDRGEGGERQGKGARGQMKQAMQQAADELRRENQSQQGRQAQRAGQARLREVREALEQAGEKGQARRSFEEQARDDVTQRDSKGDRLGKRPKAGGGQSGEAGEEAGGEQDGEAGEGEGDPDGEGGGQDGAGKDGGGKDGAGRAGGKGQAGGKGRGGKRQPFKLGQGNLDNKSRMDLLREGYEERSGERGGERREGSGNGEPGGPGSGSGKGGPDGQGQGPRIAGGQREKLTGTQGEGPDVKKTFVDAARKGFAKQGWRDVYVEYSEVAEEMLDKEQLPAGRRQTVRRYFELIRPR